MLTEREVLAEIQRGRDLHGPLTKDLSRASLILARETLEAIQEAHDAERVPRLSIQRQRNMSLLRSELVQVVAVASQWIANIDTERVRDEHEAYHSGSGGTVGQ